MSIDKLIMHLKKKRSFKNLNLRLCDLSARGSVVGHVCFQEYVCTFRAAPHGIPNISIPVDVFDVFEAT